MIIMFALCLLLIILCIFFTIMCVIIAINIISLVLIDILTDVSILLLFLFV